MEGNAVTLGITPPHTVRILNGDGHDWPTEMVVVCPGRILIRNPLTGLTLMHYEYSDAQQHEDGTWTFTGPPPWREDFLVLPGPPQGPSMDTDRPMPQFDDDPWPAGPEHDA